MFYHCSRRSARRYIIFNLFNYISFRAAGATVTALLLAFVVGPAIIARLREPARWGRSSGPKGPASHQGKRGTPTMGGLIILLATVVPDAALGAAHQPVRRRSRCWPRSGWARIGFLDDYLKIVQGKSRGLVAKWKLVGQVQLRPACSGSAPDLLPGGAGRHHSRHRDHAPLLQVSGRQLRPAGCTWSSSPWSSPAAATR